MRVQAQNILMKNIWNGLLTGSSVHRLLQILMLELLPLIVQEIAWVSIIYYIYYLQQGLF